MIKKQGMCLLLAALMAFSLVGCEQEVQETTNVNNIELIDPVNVASNVEKAAYRNMYDSKLYAATVYPTITEYSFSKDIKTDGSGVALGDTVKKGTALIYGSTEDLDKQIEEMEKRIADMDESMVEATEDFQENMKQPYQEEDWLEGVVEAYEKAKPKEQVYASQLKTDETVSEGATEEVEDRLVTNPEYTKWEKEANGWIGRYRILAHNIDMQEEAFRQNKEKYEMQRAYLLEKLENLKKNRKNSVLLSGISGEVVAKKRNDYYGEYTIQADISAIAIGDMDKKILKCSSYINDSEIALAEDYYALIDGVRYELEFQENEDSKDGGRVYSTFTFLSDTSQIQVGDYALICVMKKRSENVLSVPRTAIHKDSTGNYVYVMKNGESIVTSVKTGITDGVYTEIVSGLSEGDEVVVNDAEALSGKTATITYGSFSTDFSDRGELFSTSLTIVENPVEYGTVYFGEYLISQYQHVEKGDVIATIRVAKDDITIERNKQKLLRAQERLADLVAAGEEENEDAIEAKQEEIAEITELIEKMEADAKITEIKAPHNGLVMELNEFDKETILYPDTQFVAISDESSFSILVDNSNQLLNYGNEVTVSYTNFEGKQSSCSGKVVYAGMAGLSKDLQSEEVLIKVPKEKLSDLVVARRDRNEWWNPKQYDIKATVREMENVLVVPRSAVTEINGCTYVKVMDEQGNVKTCSFVAGGYDTSNYWIVEGLSEGMVVCLK